MQNLGHSRGSDHIAQDRIASYGQSVRFGIQVLIGFKRRQTANTTWQSSECDPKLPSLLRRHSAISPVIQEVNQSNHYLVVGLWDRFQGIHDIGIVQSNCSTRFSPLNFVCVCRMVKNGSPSQSLKWKRLDQIEQASKETSYRVVSLRGDISFTHTESQTEIHFVGGSSTKCGKLA